MPSPPINRSYYTSRFTMSPKSARVSGDFLHEPLHSPVSAMLFLSFMGLLAALVYHILKKYLQVRPYGRYSRCNTCQQGADLAQSLNQTPEILPIIAETREHASYGWQSDSEMSTADLADLREGNYREDGAATRSSDCSGLQADKSVSPLGLPAILRDEHMERYRRSKTFALTGG